MWCGACSGEKVRSRKQRKPRVKGFISPR